MLPELGQFSLSIATALALAGACLGLFTVPHASHSLAAANTGSGTKYSIAAIWIRWQSALSSLVIGQFVFSLVAFALLVFSFVQDDFSVAYVANHSNSLLPWYFKISATWGGHEGSFLLWVLTMTLWMCAVVARRSNYPRVFYHRVVGVLSLLNLGFLCFALFTSNPFTRLIPMTPADGGDLNPLLQDFGLIVHPPILYAGYIGLAVPFAFAIAALLENKVDSAWARWSRPWSNCAWAFLTVGITLGSWWAYYELGWGGWWFWDPSENASFMPWLAATALVHSLAVTEKRGTFKSWTLLLAIMGFSLSLLGGFIIRSGVITSVHAFAVDPQRGMYILIFLGLTVGAGLILYALRGGGERAYVSFSLLSREFFMLLNNVVFVIALAVVLWGTLAPIGYQLGGSHISIGPPFFNTFFIPLMLVLSGALAILPWLNWKNTNVARLRGGLLVSLGVAFVLGISIWFVLDEKSLTVSVAVVLALWMVFSHALDVVNKVRAKGKVPLAYWGMCIAHLGFAMSLLGVAITSSQSVEQDIRMAPQDTTQLSGQQITFLGVREVRGPNYIAQQGSFLVQEILPTGKSDGFEMLPEKRRYLAGGNIMTEAAIRAGFFSDLYISLGEPLEAANAAGPGANGSQSVSDIGGAGGQGAWAVRLQYKPLVRWIWLGAFLMSFGAVLAIFDVRYRRLRMRQKAKVHGQDGGVDSPTRGEYARTS